MIPHLRTLILVAVGSGTSLGGPLISRPIMEAPFELEQLFHFPTPRERYEDGHWDWQFLATKNQAQHLFNVPAAGYEDQSAHEEVFSVPRFSSASLEGYDVSAYYEEVPPLTISLRNLPSNSVAYMRAYPGMERSAPAEASVIQGSYHVVMEKRDADTNLVIADINSQLVNEGWHTLEVVQEYQGKVRVLCRSRIQVDRTVILPATIYSRE